MKMLKKMNELFSAAKKWWKTWKTFPVLSWLRAAALYRAGKFAEAERYYTEGLKKHAAHPAHLCARLDLAYCLFRSGKFEEAERHLRFVIAHSPDSREAYLRLARLQIWTGHALEAAWTMRRALQRVSADPELAATFLLALLEADGPAYLVAEAAETARRLRESAPDHARLELALTHLEFVEGDQEKGREQLARLSHREPALFEAIVLFSEALIEEGKIAHARRQLRRAMSVAPDHPRVLSILALSYLRSGPFYSPDYACQLALRACQTTGWLSPREMHILAEAYYHSGDKMSALLVASKAKQAGSRLMGTYRETRTLERLIETLSTGTLA